MGAAQTAQTSEKDQNNAALDYYLSGVKIDP